MLLEFRATNFKSFKGSAAFSMVSSSDASFENTNTRETGIKSIPRINCSAAIYGHNASGKSNLLNAIGLFKMMVTHSANHRPDQALNSTPFKLDPESANAPSEFDITFMHEGVRYQYGFSYNKTRVIEEWLFVYKTAKPQHWFSRVYDASTNEDEYYLGNGLTGQKHVWKQATKHNSLFLSTAAQLNSPQLTIVYSWIVENIVIIGAEGRVPDKFTMSQIGNEEKKSEILDFLRASDITIDDISTRSEQVTQQTFSLNMDTAKVEGDRVEKEIEVPQFHHRSETGSALFELNEESLGTQKLFSLSGLMLDILSQGKVLVFDELNNSMHTLVAKHLVDLFHNPRVNTSNAQLIFSTHDTALLDTDLLRRDQIWFIEKNNASQASELYPLLEYSPRKNEDIEKGYLRGRYGATPFIDNLALEF